MKLISVILALMLITAGCASQAPVTEPTQIPAPGETTITLSPVTETAPFTSTLQTTDSVPATLEATGAAPSPGSFSPKNVTLADNGKTIVMNTGESFLLNLGMDIYDWSVEIDNQDVLSRVIGVMVIRGAQGIFQARAPGQAVLRAAGNPLCAQSTPPCMMPSMLFNFTVIVK